LPSAYQRFRLTQVVKAYDDPLHGLMSRIEWGKERIINKLCGEYRDLTLPAHLDGIGLDWDHLRKIKKYWHFTNNLYFDIKYLTEPEFRHCYLPLKPDMPDDPGMDFSIDFFIELRRITLKNTDFDAIHLHYGIKYRPFGHLQSEHILLVFWAIPTVGKLFKSVACDGVGLTFAYILQLAEYLDVRIYEDLPWFIQCLSLPGVKKLFQPAELGGIDLNLAKILAVIKATQPKSRLATITQALKEMALPIPPVKISKMDKVAKLLGFYKAPKSLVVEITDKTFRGHGNRIVDKPIDTPRTAACFQQHIQSLLMSTPEAAMP